MFIRDADEKNYSLKDIIYTHNNNNLQINNQPNCLLLNRSFDSGDDDDHRSVLVVAFRFDPTAAVHAVALEVCAVRCYVQYSTKYKIAVTPAVTPLRGVKNFFVRHSRDYNYPDD